jgi:hypothetical protein
MMMRPLNLKLLVSATTAFAALLYLVCVSSQPLFPDWPMHGLLRWQATFPGFTWTLGGVLLGLIELVAFIAIASAAYVWIYNFFAVRFTPSRT